MWILDTNADFFQGRRMWLRPGRRYLFGRVKKDGVMIAIDHKTVSRQHFNISVDPVKDADVGQIHTRTKIRIEDHSKTGTYVNGELIKKKSPKNEQEPNPVRELKDAENSIRPGSCPYEFTVTWQPCVFTFNLLKKEIKSGVLKTKQERVRDLDIKAISDFSSENTTHVVASKRNTAKGLLALVNAKYLVTESYLDALDYVASPATLSQEVNLSPLETDFDSAWPHPKDHLPPPGKEPTIRPAESYQPDPTRVNVFEHYTFVFGDQTQYDTLLPVITSGHGKAVLFKVVNFETTSEELIQFLHNATGNKAGDTTAGSKGGVILVRWTGKEDVQEWTTALVNETALKTDQRAIDQSEFLDAILANDAGLLKQPIPFESTNEGGIAPPPSAVSSLVTGQASGSYTNGSSGTENESRQTAHATKAIGNAAATSQPSQTSEQDVSQVNGARGEDTRPLPVPKVSQLTKFKNFDDGFDPDAVAAYEEDEVIEEAAYISEPESQARSPIVIKEEPQSTTRKRPRSPTEQQHDTFAKEMDDLLPAATALKRRKLAEAAENGRTIEEDIQPGPLPVKKIKVEREIDVREAARKQRQEKEEAARREEEELEAGLPGIEDKAPANLVDVVTIDLPVRDSRSKANNRVNDRHGPDWDPKWNGRKNFKGFRRNGEPAQRRSHASKVIVPLVEVPNKTGGLGDQYWSKTEEEQERERERKRREDARIQRTTQSQTQPSSRTISGEVNGRSRTRIVLDDDDEDMDDLIGQSEEDVESASIATMTTGISRLQRESEDTAEHEIDPGTPRRTRAADRTRQASENASEAARDDDTPPRATQSQKGKRPATSKAETSNPKRQKTLPVPVTNVRGDDGSEDEDDSDDMKFRFGTRARRGRGGGRGRGRGRLAS
ncbi:DNA damage response protein RcaA [Fonsecaea pedrosoi]|nr:DNA damage response protein RcaA [Fonsecaea pedrosoi]